MRGRLKTGVGIVVVAGALLLAGCGGGSSPKASSSSGSSGSSTSSSASSSTVTNHITISNFMYSPMAATVAPGSTVTVTNKDSVTHTLSATGNQFNTGDIGSNQTKTFKAPTKPGTYHYICDIHQYMMGTITVK